MFNRQPNQLDYDCTRDGAGFDWWEGVVACGGPDLFGSEVFGLDFFGSEVFGSNFFGLEVFGSEVFGSDDSDFSGSKVFGSHTSDKYIPVKIKWLIRCIFFQQLNTNFLIIDMYTYQLLIVKIKYLIRCFFFSTIEYKFSHYRHV